MAYTRWEVFHMLRLSFKHLFINVKNDTHDQYIFLRQDGIGHLLLEMEYFANTAKFNIILRLVAKNNVNNNEIKGIAVISAQKFAASPYRVRDLTELRFPLYRVSLFLLTMIKTNPREKRRPRVESANV